MTNIKKEKPNGAGTTVPIRPRGIGTRISEVANLFGSRKSAADVADVSVASLQRYIAGEVQPPFEAVAKIALAAGVSLNWLATGEGPMRVGAGVVETAPEYGLEPGGVGQEMLKNRLKKVSEARDVVLRAFADEGYEPTGAWGALLLSMVYSGEITEHAVRQILQQLKSSKTDL